MAAGGVATPVDIRVHPATLCAIAKSDAKHDFGGGVNPGMLDSTLPPGIGCVADSEDSTLASIGINNIGPAFVRNDAIFNSPYIFANCNYENLDVELAKFSEGWNNELGFIVDAYSGRFTDFCKKLKTGAPRPSLKYYWIETPETVYDPAPKTRADTPAGREIASNNLIFATEDLSGEYISHPIIHKKYDYSPIRELNGLNQYDRERMFYSNYNITQFSTVNSESITVLSDTVEGLTKNIIVNEQAAEIKQKNFDYAAYELLQNTEYTDAINKILNISIANPTAKIHTPISTKYRYPLKRLGDQGQALACLRSMIVRYPTPTGIVKKTFNQNLCFVTHDKLALASAITYGVPAIIFCRQDGNFEVFINTIYITPEQLLANARSKYENIYNLYVQQYTLLNTILRQAYRTVEAKIYGLIHSSIVKFIRLLNTFIGLGGINDIQKNELDTAYINFFKELYRYRCDMLYYHGNLRNIKDISDLELPINVNDIDDINTINNYHAKLIKEYSNLDMQITHVNNIFNRYIISPGGSLLSLVNDPSVDTNVLVEIITTRQISRVSTAPSDDVTMSKLDELKLFTATRESISARTFRTAIARIAGIDFIHEYANALYYYGDPESFLSFLQVFTIIRQLITRRINNPTTLALGEILAERIVQIESYKDYRKNHPEFVFTGGDRKLRNTRKIRKRMYGGNLEYEVLVNKTILVNNELDVLEDYLKWLKVYAINSLEYYNNDELRIRTENTSIDIDNISDIGYNDETNTTYITTLYGVTTPISGPVQIVFNITTEFPFFIDNPMKYSIHMYANTSSIYNSIISNYNNNDIIALSLINISVDRILPPVPSLSNNNIMRRKITQKRKLNAIIAELKNKGKLNAPFAKLLLNVSRRKSNARTNNNNNNVTRYVYKLSRNLSRTLNKKQILALYNIINDTKIVRLPQSRKLRGFGL
jgi:hypothetical protein